MGYIEKSLGEHEVLLYKAHIHWILRAYYWLLFAIAEGALIWLRVSYPNIIILPVFFGLTAVFVLLFLRYIVPIWVIEIGLTDYRIIVKHGWIARVTDELGLHAIEEVNLVQSIWGRLFNFGTLLVHGTGEDELNIEWIADPLSFRRAIETAREHALQRFPNPKG